MHMVIRAIVYAHNEKEALDKARGIFENLCGQRGQLFDYFVLFDEDSPMSGKNRWGNLPAVARANSPEGKKLIDDGMQYTRDEFMRNMAQIREALLVLSDEELFTGELGPSAIAARAFDNANKGREFLFTYDPGMVRHFMGKVGEYLGPSVYLYGDDGDGIRTPEHLGNVLNKWKCIYEDEGRENPYKDLDIFVVPADVHH